MIVDPRDGDIENDHSSPIARSLWRIGGNLLIEISPLKLLGAILTLVVIPAALLGLAPIVGSIWLGRIYGRFEAALGATSILLLALLVLIALVAGRSLFRIVESIFWSLNALVVQPGYALCREALRHLSDRLSPATLDANARARRSAAMAVGAGFLAAALAIAAALLVWPATRWSGSLVDLASPARLLAPALANAAFSILTYLAIASAAWGLADGNMPQPRDLRRFDEADDAAGTVWRVAHLSDIHVVGERFGYRIESGRRGPRGNVRFRRVLERLSQIDRAEPFERILISGDVTDAGRASEWAEFLDCIAAFPALRRKILILPGNHDLNIIDPTNPARLELPFSAPRRLRKVRALAAMADIQGEEARVVDLANGQVGASLREALAPHAELLRSFADRGGAAQARDVDRVWRAAFPQVLPPAEPGGLGVILLDSNAETHFSFTNALGMLSALDRQAIDVALRAYPEAVWVLGLHHHLVEYPQPAKALSDRIGTALINGSWFVRSLQEDGRRMVAMHGHRHKDWIGHCGTLRIVSAPSPVMDATLADPTHFYVHRLQRSDGRLRLLEPERIDIAPDEPPGPETADVAHASR